MTQVKFFKLTELPDPTEPDAFYLISDDSDEDTIAEAYLTSATGAVKKLGNSELFEQLLAQNERFVALDRTLFGVKAVGFWSFSANPSPGSGIYYAGGDSGQQFQPSESEIGIPIGVTLAETLASAVAWMNEIADDGASPVADFVFSTDGISKLIITAKQPGDSSFDIYASGAEIEVSGEFLTGGVKSLQQTIESPIQIRLGEKLDDKTGIARASQQASFLTNTDQIQNGCYIVPKSGFRFVVTDLIVQFSTFNPVPLIVSDLSLGFDDDATNLGVITQGQLASLPDTASVLALKCADISPHGLSVPATTEQTYLKGKFGSGGPDLSFVTIDIFGYYKPL